MRGCGQGRFLFGTEVGLNSKEDCFARALMRGECLDF